jgi:hypothetical protein
MAFLQRSGDRDYFYMGYYTGGNRHHKAWVYHTVDALDTITTAGYFDDFTGQTPVPGDRIHVHEVTDRNDLSTAVASYTLHVIDFDGGEFLTIDGDGPFATYTGALHRSSKQRFGGHIDLEFDEGVTPGSSTADFHTRLQRALDRSADSNTKEIWVPSGSRDTAGRMLFDGSVTISSPVRIIGKGNGRSFIAGGSTAALDTWVKVGTRAADADEIEYVTLENLEFNANTAQSVGAALSLARVQRFKALNCGFGGCKQIAVIGSAAMANAALDVSFIDCDGAPNANSTNLPVFEIRSGGRSTIRGGLYNGNALAYLVGQRDLTTTVTITNATPVVVTWTNHDMAPGDPFQLSTTGVLPAALQAGTDYFIKEVLTDDTFTLSATEGGAAWGTDPVHPLQSGVHTLDATYGNYDGLEVTGIVGEQWRRALSIEGSGGGNIWLHDSIIDRSSISVYIAPIESAFRNIFIHDNVFSGLTTGYMAEGAIIGPTRTGSAAAADTTPNIGMWIGGTAVEAEVQAIHIHDNTLINFGGNACLVDVGTLHTKFNYNFMRDCGFKGEAIVKMGADNCTIMGNDAIVYLLAAAATYGIDWDGAGNTSMRRARDNNWSAAQTDWETGGR